MGKKERDGRRLVKAIREEWEKSRHLVKPPSQKGEVLAGLFSLERERLMRHRESSMVSMLDGTLSLSWVFKGISFTPSVELQLDLAQLIKETLLTQKVEKPEKFPRGAPYAGWVVKEPFLVQTPRTLEDEPLFDGSLVAPASELIGVSSGVILHQKGDVKNYYIDKDGQVEKLLLGAALQTGEHARELLTSWKVVKPKRFSLLRRLG